MISRVNINKTDQKSPLLTKPSMQPSKSPAFPFTILGGQLQAGWWYTYPSEDMKVQLGWLSHVLWKNKKCFKPRTSYWWFIPFSNRNWGLGRPRKTADKSPTKMELSFATIIKLNGDFPLPLYSSIHSKENHFPSWVDNEVMKFAWLFRNGGANHFKTMAKSAPWLPQFYLMLYWFRFIFFEPLKIPLFHLMKY